MDLTIGIQNKETTEAGTLIITMNPVNTARWISTPELIQAEIAVQPYGVISVPEYEDLGSTELMCYVTLNYVTYGAGLADLIAGSIGDEITFTATGTGGGGANDAEIAKWIEGSAFSLYDNTASFVGISAFAFLSSYIKLQAITIENAAKISGYAFTNASNLTSISAPKASVIGDGAFGSCGNLETAYIPLASDIGFQAFVSCSKLSNVTLPSVFTNIGQAAFSGTAIKSISITGPDSIAPRAFQNCKSLSYANISNTKSFASSVFLNCTSLETVVLEAAKSIANAAFSGCEKLESCYIYTLSTSAPSVAATAFSSTPLVDDSYLGHYGSIYVPSDMVSIYLASTAWSYVSDRITSIPT